jgi:hypothetical protein
MSGNCLALCSGAVVVVEKATDALASAHGTLETPPSRTIDELVPQPLMFRSPW